MTVPRVGLGGRSADGATERLYDAGPRNPMGVYVDKSSSLQYQREEPGGTAAEGASEYLYAGGPRNPVGVAEDRSSSQQYLADPVQLQVCGDGPVQTAIQVDAQPKPRPAQATPSILDSNVHVDDYVGHSVRPVRARQAPQRLVVGDPLDPRFNRTSGR